MNLSALSKWATDLHVVDPPETPKTAFFYAGKDGYYLRREDGTFIPLTTENQVRQHLERVGVNDKSAQTAALCRIRTEQYVKYVGPLAGWTAGVHTLEDSGGLILVTESPRIIEAREGDSAFLERVVTSMLEDPTQPNQVWAFLAWLKQARANVKAGCRRPLPVAAFVGPRNSGKSFLIELARVALGGRQANSFRAMSADTAFNHECAGAELLVIDDVQASRDHRARTRLAQAIKSWFFAGALRVERKHHDVVNLRPVHACMIAVNDEPEHVSILPAFDDSLADKLSLFSCQRGDFWGLERKAIGKLLNDQLPGFLHFVEDFTPPPELIDTRTGAAAWQHPEVLRLLQSIANETHLAELIVQNPDVRNRCRRYGEWHGTAAELQRLLLGSETTRHSARELLSWPNATGTYLGRLVDAGRPGISRGGQREGIQTWKIKIPTTPEDED